MRPGANSHDLPPIDQFPARANCLRQQEPVEVAGLTHWALYPLLTDRGAVGVLEIESETDLDGDQPCMVSSLLRSYRNVQGLLDYSERDVLTGLLNRKTFDDSFYKVTAADSALTTNTAGRRGEAIMRIPYIGVIDIDHFKRVNDHFGHLMGDEVLLLMSRLMRASFRFQDRLYRFGGEEFVVLLRCASDEDAAAAFERMRVNTEAYAFPQVGRITVSIGFTCVNGGDSAREAFARADKAGRLLGQGPRPQLRGQLQRAGCQRGATARRPLGRRRTLFTSRRLIEALAQAQAQISRQGPCARP